MEQPIVFICGKTDLTADLVLIELKKRNIEVVRINVEDFPTKLNFSAGFNLETPKSWFLKFYDSKLRNKFFFKEVRSVYYRPHKEQRASLKIKNVTEKNLIIEQSQLFIEWLEDLISPCFWLNSPRAVDKARSKVLQLTLADSLGFLTPKTLITNDPEEALNFYKKHKGSIIAKLLQATPSTRKLPGFIFTKKLTPREIKLINQVKYSPVLFQKYVPKNYEIRATVVGEQVFAAKIDSQALQKTIDDWRSYEFGNPPPHSPIKLPLEVQKKLIKMNEILGIKFGAYDLIYTPKGGYVFLEVNANGQWGWIQELTKLPISSAIAEILIKGGK